MSPPLPDNFRRVPGKPGYCVSRDGRVFSCLRWGSWREIKSWVSEQRKGHRLVNLFAVGGGRPRRAKVADLVAAAFLGPRPAGEHTIHRDRNKANCRASNLFYGSVQVARFHYARRGPAHPLARFTVGDVVSMRRYIHAHYEAQGEAAFTHLAEKHRCTVTNIKLIAKVESWRHVDAGVPAWKPGPVKPLPSRAKLTADDVRDIKRRLRRKEKAAIIHRAYAHRGISVFAIKDIEDGVTWAAIEI